MSDGTDNYKRHRYQVLENFSVGVEALQVAPNLPVMTGVVMRSVQIDL